MKAKVALVACESYDRKCVEKSIKQAVDLIGGINRFIKKDDRVLIKPNLCLAEPPDRYITTHPEIIRMIVLMAVNAGAKVTIADNPVGAADRTRLDQIWEKTGINQILKDIEHQRSFLDRNMIECFSNINDKDFSYFISSEIFDMDFVINVPKYKSHSFMTFTGAVKNLYGLLPGNSKKKLHSELPEQVAFGSLLCDIYNLIMPGLNIMDAIIGLEGNGPGVQGTPRKMGLILSSDNGIALDYVAAMMMGIDPMEIHTNRIGYSKGYGKGLPEDIEIIGEDINKYIMRDFIRPLSERFSPELTRKLFKFAKANVHIDTDKCKVCLLCKENCPANSIKINDKIAEIDQKICISCMTCHEICPEGAVITGRSVFYDQLKTIRHRKNEKSQ